MKTKRIGINMKKLLLFTLIISVSSFATIVSTNCQSNTNFEFKTKVRLPIYESLLSKVNINRQINKNFLLENKKFKTISEARIFIYSIKKDILIYIENIISCNIQNKIDLMNKIAERTQNQTYSMLIDYAKQNPFTLTSTERKKYAFLISEIIKIAENLSNNQNNNPNLWSFYERTKNLLNKLLTEMHSSWKNVLNV